MSGSGERPHNLFFGPLVYLIGLFYGLSFWSRAARDPDLGWHLFGGAYIDGQHQVPGPDLINTFNTRWQDYHWLAQWGMFRLYAWGGYEALRVSLGILAALLLCSIVALAAQSAACRRLKPLAIFPSLLAFLLIGQVIEIRPQILALLVIVLALLFLSKRNSPAELPILFLCSTLLVNVHVYWIFIPTLWFIYRCLPRFVRNQDASALYCWGGFVALSLCGLLSPYGIFQNDLTLHSAFSNYYLLLDYVNLSPLLAHEINELKSALASGTVYGLVMLLYFTLLLRRTSLVRCRADIGNFSAAWLGFLLSVLAVKYVPLLVLFSLPFLIRHRPHWPRFSGQPLFHISSNIRNAVLGIVLIGLVIYTSHEIPYKTPSLLEAEALYPIEACQKLPSLNLKPIPTRSHIRVLTHFDHGGWCRWAMYQADPSKDLRVTTDNRTQWVPAEHYQQSFDLFFGQRDWWKTLQDWDPDIAVVKNGAALTSLLALLNTQWKFLYHAGDFSVFERTRSSQS